MLRHFLKISWQLLRTEECRHNEATSAASVLMPWVLLLPLPHALLERNDGCYETAPAYAIPPRLLVVLRMVVVRNRRMHLDVAQRMPCRCHFGPTRGPALDATGG